ncbi:MAG: NAD(P)/FAD-dependent oxidoreductase [Chloroflexi bacterium]|nr:NAD(P)/FAD-dependent oxidoreductase [Chloroflexota bacterium]
MTKAERTKYLIIGNSAGGIGAAEAIRQVDKVGTMTIVSDEPYPAYSRPLISEYLAERRPLERMLFRPSDFYEKNNIQAILGRKAEQLNSDEHTIKLDDGRKIIWEKLLLATGGLPIVPGIEGIGLKGVFTFTKFDDAKAIDEFLNQHQARKVRGVVIGGGLIGVSVTEALRKREIDITIVEMRERLLNTILDEETSALEAETLRRGGVEIITGHTVAKVSSYLDGEASGVTLDDGRSLPCEMVIVAIGVRPRTEFVSDTKIKVNRGIRVDRYMATSSPDVNACGDVDEAYDFVYGENRLTPIWPNAYIGGRVAGFNMAAIPTEYRGGTAMNSLKYFGLDVVSAGMVMPPDASYEVIRAKYGQACKKVILKDGLIMGMVFSGDIEKSGIVYNLMKDRVKVGAFQQALVAEDFGLVSLPEEIWRPHLEIPSAIADTSVISMEQAEEVIAGE